MPRFSLRSAYRFSASNIPRFSERSAYRFSCSFPFEILHGLASSQSPPPSRIAPALQLHHHFTAPTSSHYSQSFSFVPRPPPFPNDLPTAIFPRYISASSISITNIYICSIYMLKLHRRASMGKRALPDAKDLLWSKVTCLHGTSHKSLVSILNTLRANQELLEQLQTKPLTAKDFERLCERFYNAVGQTETLVLQNGDEFKWDACSLAKLIEFYVENSQNVRDLIRAAHARCPSSPTRPWRLLVYTDEATPGMVLRPENWRKCACFYVSFKEFGPKVLKSVAAWLPLAVLRSSVSKEIPSGFSEATGRLMRRVCLGPGNIRTEGLLLNLKGVDGLDEPTLRAGRKLSFGYFCAGYRFPYLPPSISDWRQPPLHQIRVSTT